MAISGGGRLKRDDGIPLRLTLPEKKKLEKLAAAVGLDMAVYVRCKTFDIPFHMVGGKEIKPAKTSS